VKFFKKVVLFVGSVTILSVPVGAEVVDRIIAVVNNEVVTLSEFNKAFEPYAKNIEEHYKGKDKEAVINQSRNMFLQRLIDNILIEQEAKKNQ
jgi:peptidyl-prolyl cis-trans isomerase SurA